MDIIILVVAVLTLIVTIYYGRITAQQFAWAKELENSKWTPNPTYKISPNKNLETIDTGGKTYTGILINFSHKNHSNHHINSAKIELEKDGHIRDDVRFVESFKATPIREAFLLKEHAHPRKNGIAPGAQDFGTLSIVFPETTIEDIKKHSFVVTFERSDGTIAQKKCLIK